MFLEVLGSPIEKLAERLPSAILERLGSLHPTLFIYPAQTADARLARAFEIPPVDVLSYRVSKCSFRYFDKAAEYEKSLRAKEFVTWKAPRLDLYRIYFNTYSKKIYIDLNGSRWRDSWPKIDVELLYAEILQTLIFVLTCEVELAEAREIEQSTGGEAAVTSDVIEVVIPSKKA